MDHWVKIWQKQGKNKTKDKGKYAKIRKYWFFFNFIRFSDCSLTVLHFSIQLSDINPDNVRNILQYGTIGYKHGKTGENKAEWGKVSQNPQKLIFLQFHSFFRLTSIKLSENPENDRNILQYWHRRRNKEARGLHPRFNKNLYDSGKYLAKLKIFGKTHWKTIEIFGQKLYRPI